jgi:oxygen-independent coproporphyrinogen-3 oxidase
MPALLHSLLMDGDDAARAGTALPVLRRRATQALTIYVHIPFCIQKCGYCDFNASLYRRDAAQTYISALRREIIYTATEQPWMSYQVPSVYFGGTPSTLAPTDLLSLLNLIRDRFPVSADAEITLEADPGTIDLAGFEALRAGALGGSASACSLRR